MSVNMDLWNKVRRVPPEHLKGFKRGGGFTGTAIKPMWSIQVMTETFGPCGIGWGNGEPVFQIVPGDNKEVMVYCHVAVWINDRANVVYGVGGDKIVTHIKANPNYKTEERWLNDDEAFKKAFTDAMTNALKLLGVGADIHMGLWDGNKYAESKDDDHGKTAPPAPMQAAGGTPGASKAANRAIYDDLSRAIANASGVAALKKIYEGSIAAIEAMPPDWVDELRVEYSDRLSELKLMAAA